MRHIFIILSIILSALLFNCHVSQAQEVSPSGTVAPAATTVRGVVRDSVSREPIPYAAIFLQGTERGVLADENGRFEVVTAQSSPAVAVISMGYGKKVVPIRSGRVNTLTVDMVPVGLRLDEVVVKPGKEHYSKKNNPAVRFVERIMNAKRANDPRRLPDYNYDKYEKITIALNDFKGSQGEGWQARQFGFLNEFIDTSEVSGKPILNVSVKEKSSAVFNRADPRAEKEYVMGIRRHGLDDIADQQAVQTFMEDVFREVDIYDNDVNILQNRFVSPLSRIGTDFYKYYLTDTVVVEGDSCVELTFVPHSPQSFGFTGRMYVPKNDTTMFVKRVIMRVPATINLNFVDNLLITQEYDRAPDGSRLKTKDDMTIEFSVIPGMQGLYARRNTTYRNHRFTPPEIDGIFDYVQREIIAPHAIDRDDTYWAQHRGAAITRNEDRMAQMVERLRGNKFYYWTEKILKILVSGYINTGKNSKWDFGPMNTTISFNDIEGLRLRAGGMTTANLNKHLFANGYIAYGFKDKKIKYKAELEYSFKPKEYHPREFPVHSIRASQLYDVDMLGQHYMFTNMDNVFLSLKRQSDTQMTYHRVSKLEYTLELQNNFSVAAGITYERQESTGYMRFVNGYGHDYRHYDEASFNVQLRFAPGEKFFQTKTQRLPVNLDAPVFVLAHTFAPKGFLGSMFTLNKTEFSVQKRFWFSAFGYTDIIVKAGKVWSRCPYPNLLIPNANLSYTIQPESFALMNAMEFINDQYVSWDLTYWANGALLNRIPLVNRLKLREVIAFRGLYGKLTDRNDPSLHPELFAFPADARVQRMTHTPYMEISAGLDNIFKILRVDYVWRLTYRDAPDINRGGVRVALHFTF